MNTHAAELTDPFNAACLLIILLQLIDVISYFDVYSLSIAELENEDISKIYLTAEKPPWNPSTNEYSERKTHMLNHQGQISIPATVIRGPAFVGAVISYSLAYDATDVMDPTALSAQIQISIALIATVRKLSVEPIVLAIRWGITPEKAQKTIQATTQKGMRTMTHLLLSR